MGFLPDGFYRAESSDSHRCRLVDGQHHVTGSREFDRVGISKPASSPGSKSHKKPCPQLLNFNVDFSLYILHLTRIQSHKNSCPQLVNLFNVKSLYLDAGESLSV